MQKKLKWEVFSNLERNEGIETIKSAISNADGYIMNFNMFSDLALALSVEIEENKIEELHNGLSKIASVSTFSADDVRSDSKKEWIIFINILFGKGTGDLKMEIPDAPG